MKRRNFVQSIATLGSVMPLTSLSQSGYNSGGGAEEDTVFDLVVYGATPGGIACAVRAAREGLQVLLISFNDRLGGMLTSGLGVWDTLYEGYRSPLYNELRQAFFDHYRTRYGEESESYRRALPGESGHNNGTFEANVAEMYVNEMVKRERNIRVLLDHYPVGVQRAGRKISSADFRQMHGDNQQRISAAYFADCSYEGDLMAAAGVPYSVGRESRLEHDEQHAGVVFMLPVDDDPHADSRDAAIFSRLNIRHFGDHQIIIYPDSTHESDTNVQAYNMRYYITDRVDNQIEVQPSAQYDPEYLKTLEFAFPREVKPNRKLGLNRPQLVGLHQTYVEGDWETRRHVVDEHVRVTRDMLYFKQNDGSVPAEERALWRNWGLAKDEFVDNNHNPNEIYVRESRRLQGKYMFTENDLNLHPGYDRAPVHPDSIATVEWYMDAHACTWQKSDRGGLHEGKMMLHKETFPGQLPYRCILSPGLDNFLVPVCMATTHVAWGAVRLEPTWMQVGESAAYAVLQAMDEKSGLHDIDTEKLVRTLAEKRSMVSFFNDFYIDGEESWIPAVQYFGTKGFFTDYDAKPGEPLEKGVAEAWVAATKKINEGGHIAGDLITKLSQNRDVSSISLSEFSRLLEENGLAGVTDNDPDAKVTRATACENLYKNLSL